MKYDFNEKLSSGLSMELAIANTLNEFHSECLYELSEGYFPDYDLACMYHPWCATIEVKYDEMAPRTGNIAFEIGALSKSKADKVWYGIKHSPQSLLFNRLDLLEWLENYDEVRVVSGGDQSHTLYLVSHEDVMAEAPVTLVDVTPPADNPDAIPYAIQG